MIDVISVCQPRIVLGEKATIASVIIMLQQPCLWVSSKSNVYYFKLICKTLLK